MRLVNRNRPTYHRKHVVTSGAGLVTLFDMRSSLQLVHVIDHINVVNRDTVSRSFTMKTTDNASTFMLGGTFALGASASVEYPSNISSTVDQERLPFVVKSGELLELWMLTGTTTDEVDIRVDYRRFYGVPDET